MGKPYYYADKTFSIEESRVTQIDTLVCTLQNIKVTVSYSEDLKTLMGEDCKVSVTVGEGALDFMKKNLVPVIFGPTKRAICLSPPSPVRSTVMKKSIAYR